MADTTPLNQNPDRAEHDSLGEVRLPADALYGAQTARAIRNFPISGRTAPHSLIRAYLRLKAAAARANSETGALSTERASLIEKAVQEILDLPLERWSGLFPLDAYQAGAGTSQNMNINEVIANVGNRIAGHPLGSYTPLHPNDHVNRSQSTNDTYPTAMRLALLEESHPLLNALSRLAQAFEDQALRWRDTPKAARTHLQDAVPIRLGQEFEAYSLTIRRLHDWIAQSREGLRELGIGGSAAGTGLTVPSGYQEAILRQLELLTGERLRSAQSLCEAMQSQSPVLHYSSSLRTMALELTRICNDLRLLASGPLTGFAEILLPAVQPGSSIMPGKVNPSILEMVNQVMFAVIGQDSTVAMAVQAGQLELNVMMPVMAFASLEATRISAQALETLRTRCIEGISANEVRLRKNYESTPQIATALSPRLGYETTARLVQESLRTGESVVGLVRKRKLLPEEELRSLLDVRALTGGS